MAKSVPSELRTRRARDVVRCAVLAWTLAVACGQATIDLGESSPGLVEAGVGDAAPEAAPVEAGVERCASSADCTGSRAVCDEATETCAGCLGDGDCKARGWELCDTVRKECIQCRGDSACSSPLFPFVCEPRLGSCVISIPCSTGCFGLRCDEERGRCVQCIGAEDCVGLQLCVGGLCVECQKDSDCDGDEPYCDRYGRCVPCTRDGHCASGLQCETFRAQCRSALLPSQ